MQIGIGLPNGSAGVRGSTILDWIRRAERRGFEVVSTIDRLVYPSFDSIIGLALAAGATNTLALQTNILLAPLYPRAILAKQLASIADAAGHRLTVGIAPGGRYDDYLAAGVDFGTRGRVLDDEISFVRQAWRGEAVVGDTPICAAPVVIPLLFGGTSNATVRRVGQAGDGWVSGALRDYTAEEAFADRIRHAWVEAGRSDSVLLHTCVNFALGDDADAGREHIGRYYGFAPDYAELNVADLLTSPEDTRKTVQAYDDLGFDRLLFCPAVTSLEQVDRLADAVL
ncbi:LLM class flavin-dependent oxidoreductase [Mycolicibacterium sp.]|uniref:LLM class flavin-dependent oxidoreductase n=1 Tax=Mycolicibacterium sp. TaxID=2320850 RepID=UPI001A320A59|nr:LLM class flavin-dependent oxidoreductase [Mycolicibacterium sp.]MBJ7337582.1 LLM class flavin-dependent oxidoreductase [Mycolicibacterium sp.]